MHESFISKALLSQVGKVIGELLDHDNTQEMHIPKGLWNDLDDLQVLILDYFERFGRV